MCVLDWILIIIAAGIIVMQTFRSGEDLHYVFFEMIGILVAANLSLRYYARLAEKTGVNPAITLLLIFIIFGIILWIIADLVANKVQFTLAPIDTWLGFIIGFISAWAILYVVLKVLFIVYPDGLSLNLFSSSKPTVIFSSLDNSPVAKEILNFNSFRAVTNLLNKVKLSE
ncbi:MAG: CvpA family protein [Candidatus Latescibacteria bacterium]|nr:CvpA family protein [Candidatus Latescibacterota bacterium]